MTPTDTEVEQALAGLTKAQRCRVWVTDCSVHYSKRPCRMSAVRDGMCTRHANQADKWSQRRAAQAIEAGTAETERLGAEGTKARSEGCAPTPPSQSGDA